MAKTVTCPHCGSISDVTANQAGQRLRCEFCMKFFEFVVVSGSSGKSQIKVRKSLSKKAQQKAEAGKAAEEKAAAQKRNVIMGLSIAAVCLVALISVVSIISYRKATSYETRLKQLASDDEARVETAKNALKRAGADAVATLIQGLKGDSPQARGHCLELLEKLGEKGESGLDELRAGLNVDDKDIQIACITAIGYLGKNGRAAENDVLKFLQDRDDSICSAAFTALAASSTPQKIVPVVIKIVKGENSSRKKQAIGWLGEFGPPAKSAVPTLLTVLDNLGEKDGELKESVCRSLGKIRHRDEQVVKKLSAILANVDEPLKIRVITAQALGDIGGLQALEKLKAAKTRSVNDEKAELEKARKEEYAIPVTRPKYKNVVVAPSGRRGVPDSRREWYTSSPARRPSGLDRSARFYTVRVSGGGGPSATALRETQKLIKENWQKARAAIDAAIAKIEG